MEEALVRFAVAAAIAAMAVAAALTSRRGRALRRRPFDPTGLDAGLHLFTSLTCSSCVRARAALAAGSRPFTEHTFEEDEHVLRDNHVARVPAVAFVSATGSWISEGVPSTRALDRWLGP